MAINKITVLGAGTMGMGIAQVFAEAGKTVIVRDIAEAFIQRGEHWHAHGQAGDVLCTL